MSEMTDLTAAIMELRNEIVRGGSLGAGSERLQRSISDLTDTEIESLQDRRKQAAANKTTTSMFSNIMRSQSMLFKKFSGDMRAQGEMLSDTIDEAYSKLNYKGFERMEKTVQAMFGAGGPLAKFRGAAEQTGAELTKLTKAYAEGDVRKLGEALGKSVEEVDAFERGIRERNPLVMKELEELGDSLNKATHKIQDTVNLRLNNRLGDLTKFLGGAAAASRITQEILEQQVAGAMKFGTTLDTFDAIQAGMSQEEFAQLQGQYRQAINATGMSLDDFQERVHDGVGELIAYTGSLADATRIQAQAMGQASLFGAQTTQAREDFIEGQKKIFKQLNQTISMTAEEFMQMNEQLQNSQSVRSQLYKLDVSQRAAYYQDLQLTYQRLTTMGLLQEQSMKVVEAMEAIGAKSPRERMKEAAKFQAMAGAMGMGGMGAEAAGLIRGGLRGEGDKARFAEIQQAMQQQMGGIMGQGLPQEMMMSQMIQSLGMEQYLGPTSDFADFNIQQTQQQKEIVDQVSASKDIAAKSLHTLATINQGVTNLGPALAGISGLLQNILALMGAGGLGGLAGAGAGAGKLGKLLKGGVIGAGAVSLIELLASGGERSSANDLFKGIFGEGANKALGAGMARLFAAFGDEEAQAAIKMRQKPSKAFVPDSEKTAIQTIENMQRALDEKTYRNEDERKAMIKVMEDQKMVLQGIRDGNQKTNEELEKIRKVNEDGNKQSSEQHKESMEKNNKNVRVAWHMASQAVNSGN